MYFFSVPICTTVSLETSKGFAFDDCVRATFLCVFALSDLLWGKTESLDISVLGNWLWNVNSWKERWPTEPAKWIGNNSVLSTIYSRENRFIKSNLTGGNVHETGGNFRNVWVIVSEVHCRTGRRWASAAGFWGPRKRADFSSKQECGAALARVELSLPCWSAEGDGRSFYKWHTRVG